jgi:hypothetical protein
MCSSTARIPDPAVGEVVISKDERDAKAEPKEVERWKAKRRTRLVVRIIKGETSPQEAARKHGMTVAELGEWKVPFLAAASHDASSSAPTSDAALPSDVISGRRGS